MIVVVLWFILVISCLVGPPYMHLVLHKQPEVYALLLIGLLLGVLLWVYIHEREQ